MRTSVLATSYNQTLAQRNLFLWIAVFSMTSNLLLAGVSYYLVGKERIVVTPPVVMSEFWVSSNAVSDSYLEQMAGFFVSLVLNVSPNSFATRSEQLLQHVHPQSYSAVKAQMIAQQAEIARRAMSTSFHPVSFKIDKEKLWVEVKGELRIMVGGIPFQLKSAVYLVQFTQEHGKLYIKQFNEVKYES